MILLTGCAARIDIYDNYRLDGDPTGIKFYYPKAYVLVSYTGLKDNPIKTEIVYLPDLKIPRYALLKPGFGASNLKLSFSNGMLTGIGQESDTKISETVSSFGGLIPGVESLENISTSTLPRFELYELKKKDGVVFLEKVDFRE